jgi:hypothetical protein
VTERVKGQLISSSPVMPNVDPSNKFCPMAPKVHHDLDMTGPIYHGIESHNQYVPMEQVDHFNNLKLYKPNFFKLTFHYLLSAH